MTKRREAITAGRVQEPLEAEREAWLIERLGGPDAVETSMPARRWVRGANGLWHTEPRK